jgi:type II secretory pathway component PulF
MVLPSEGAFLRLAEAEGELTRALNILARDLELRQRANDLFSLVLVWPSAVLGVLGVAFLVSAVYTVPAFESIFHNDASDMPFAAHALMLFSNFFVGVPLLISAVVIVGAIVVTMLGNWPESVRRGFAYLCLLLPAARTFYRSRLSSRTANVLCTTIDLPQIRNAGIAMVAASAGPGRFARSLKMTADQLRSSAVQPDVFAAIRDDLPRIYLYCRLAEATGAAGPVMEQLVELASEDEAIATARFERTLLVVSYLIVGLLVAAFVISMYSAMTSMPYTT